MYYTIASMDFRMGLHASENRIENFREKEKDVDR